MNDYDAKNTLWVARQCQDLARKLAPLQNVGPVGVFGWLKSLFFRPEPLQTGQLSTKDVTSIVNALLSAGNMLETSVKVQTNSEKRNE